jgi:hypothetical protein
MKRFIEGQDRRQVRTFDYFELIQTLTEIVQDAYALHGNSPRTAVLDRRRSQTSTRW